MAWDYEADVVVLGAGATGLAAAIRARDVGASVIVVEQNFDIGGTLIHSNGNVSLGGGDAIQLRDLAGKNDPEGLITIAPVEQPEACGRSRSSISRPDRLDCGVHRCQNHDRYNNREVLRAWADNVAPVRQFLRTTTSNSREFPAHTMKEACPRARKATAMFKLGAVTDEKREQ